MTEFLSLKDKQKTFEFLDPLLNPKTLLEYVFFRLNRIFKRLKENFLTLSVLVWATRYRRI